MKYDIKVFIFIALCVVLAVLIGLRCEAAINITEPVTDAPSASEPVVVLAKTPILKPLKIERPVEPVEQVEEVVEDPVEAPEKPVELPKLYTDADAIALAQMCYGESKNVKDLVTANGIVSNKAQNAACMWTILNRYDEDPFIYYARENSIAGVVAAPTQYHGYSPKNPVDEELLELAYDVLDRWNREKHGETDVGRVLPADYKWFHGADGHNHFRNSFKLVNGYWDWSLTDVYAQ